MSKIMRNLAVLLVLSMLAVACGQKPGVHLQGASSGGGGGGGGGDAGEFAEGGEGDFDFDGEGGEGDFEGEDVALEGEDVDFDGGEGGEGGGGDAPGADAAGGDGGGEGGEAGGGGGGGGEASGGGGGGGGEAGGGGGPNDTVGITSEQIKIGVHAPLSGAAPLPQDEFRSGRSMYWDHVGKVAGRNVNVIVRDDGYNPSRATTVCRELIQREEVFILVGGGGADQINACARVAAEAGVPYLSAGVDEGVLKQLPNYFALSMSYPQQAPLLTQWIAKNAKPGNGEVGLLFDRTPSFRGVRERLSQELQRAGMKPVPRQMQNPTSDAAWAGGYDTVFVIGAPAYFVQVTQAPRGLEPQWVGVGITMGLNTVAANACRRGNFKAAFLSPFPGLNQVDKLDANFKRAGGKGDIELALWGLNKTIHEVLKPLGNNPSRSGFMRSLQSNRIKTNVYPELRHSRGNHFGAQGAHMLRANCSNGRFETRNDELFKTSF
jgi:branched-chain amino acid transport system substrate-binding protein